MREAPDGRQGAAAWPCSINGNQMRWQQVIIGVVTAVVSWYAMMVVHEAGHCLGALATGATIERVELPVAGFSRTDTIGGSHPLVVIWAGPLFGAAGPLVLLSFLRRVGRRARHAVLFFLGFCLLVNGAYLAVGAPLHAGDCRVLLQHGSSQSLLIALGLALTAGGLYTWHRMGPLREWFA